jgi:transcriptional regulator MraZ
VIVGGVVFRGLNLISLDAKGRLAMPARYRARVEAMAEGRLIITIDPKSTCLLLYPLPEWEKIEEKIGKLSSFHKPTRRIQRLLIGHATEVELDSNGRLLLPTLLREYAHLDKQVMLVGQGKKFEIWSEANWQAGREEWLAEESQDELTPPELESFSL